ncbi:U8 snoRNA-decapping enzyme isoform X2 [Macrosteles quadrilineatus]|uniref:U8 snoRNA-decapping enzyme isoform X2 n=1 Tax=Macrosteles quadrilineatus TaxID=74068 RepID=UPI0023E2655A|nr:U8 snoRNA-decapping enzyme isoform X2 [Macrosteles quadrilineatus]XP_054287113.1 U8 snoRNA-decapping enzyme isoform X2 [Macrosteles quadrilineatus]
MTKINWKTTSKSLLKIMASDTGDRTWGHLASTEHFGRITDSSDYIQVDRDNLKNDPYFNSTQASHCMIFARNDKKTFGVYNPRAAILMQMRFDGNLGFPGGLVDDGEQPVEALNRELSEEMNLDVKKHHVSESDYVVSHWSIAKRLCLHFYALEVSLDEILEIEKTALLAKDYGSEVLGTVRVPLYTMGDGYRGFPTFLSNAFIGNSRLQLLQALRHLNILTDQEIQLAQKAVPLPLKS